MPKDKDKKVVPLRTIEPAKEDEKSKKDGKPSISALKVGSAAPKLSAEKWMKGQEVKNLEPGNVYVVEFWATWCPPCLKSIPHLTELQKRHKDLTIIGMASSEQTDDKGPDKREAKLAKFVKDQGGKMDYRVAYDSDRSMSRDWMEPAGQSGIPCSFVVGGDGKLAYIGHPMELDDVLPKVVAGTWRGQADLDEIKKADDEFGTIMRGARNDPAR